jgi:alpha-tubulin suppressor-like RCC1 family protein
VAAGKQHTLLLTNDGKVYSMGKNKDGCLGTTRLSRVAGAVVPYARAVTDV